MSETPSDYTVNGRKVRTEVYTAAVRLRDFCMQFDKMTDEEKRICMNRVGQLSPVELATLYNFLAEWFGDKK